MQRHICMYIPVGTQKHRQMGLPTHIPIQLYTYSLYIYKYTCTNTYIHACTQIYTQRNLYSVLTLMCLRIPHSPTEARSPVLLSPALILCAPHCHQTHAIQIGCGLQVQNSWVWSLAWQHRHASVPSSLTCKLGPTRPSCRGA